MASDCASIASTAGRAGQGRAGEGGWVGQDGTKVDEQWWRSTKDALKTGAVGVSCLLVSPPFLTDPERILPSLCDGMHTCSAVCPVH